MISTLSYPPFPLSWFASEGAHRVVNDYVEQYQRRLTELENDLRIANEATLELTQQAAVWKRLFGDEVRRAHDLEQEVVSLASPSRADGEL